MFRAPVPVVAGVRVVSEDASVDRVAHVVGTDIAVVACHVRAVAAHAGQTVGFHGTRIPVLARSIIFGIAQNTFMGHRVAQDHLADVLVREFINTIQIGFTFPLNLFAGDYFHFPTDGVHVFGSRTGCVVHSPGSTGTCHKPGRGRQNNQISSQQAHHKPPCRLISLSISTNIHKPFPKQPILRNPATKMPHPGECCRSSREPFHPAAPQQPLSTRGSTVR